MEYDNAIDQTARRLMVVLLGFLTVVVVFGAVALFLGPVAEPDKHEELKFLRWIAAGLPLLELAMAAQIWMTMSKRLELAEGWKQRIGIMRGRTIVVAALFEAPALLAGVVALLLGPSWHLVPAFVLFLGAVAGLLPTRSRVRRAVGNEDGDRLDQYS